jgi:hypothetical protein
MLLKKKMKKMKKKKDGPRRERLPVVWPGLHVVWPGCTEQILHVISIQLQLNALVNAVGFSFIQKHKFS